MTELAVFERAFLVGDFSAEPSLLPLVFLPKREKIPTLFPKKFTPRQRQTIDELQVYSELRSNSAPRKSMLTRIILGISWKINKFA
ncbi:MULTISPECIES: hypothetical protein [unclassified Undibacterium]|uniref:hypothetical protein n=1 Tax=unclassified Undibacterium TaxID=2630295 RepID=UPI002AC8AFAA|nr:MULTISPECIES: hypothetical protein [unclassified Undibacterium]MEB0139977.1 hypothetical protein [Undibacterium sp. CCC2.1]MEB0172950.1 hypothetical protein [Undibacterium sp. CCC1.1]MEB0176777.1 hypothetical protein [Undibacterium sp. CCC3.4]MEB0216876.1 hypothetical protein [Undibacterium sp. 5I2]WPX45016.1 hypothetical protein RHM61_07260 [Undibacterium sp. CCC3.4]